MYKIINDLSYCLSTDYIFNKYWYAICFLLIKNLGEIMFKNFRSNIGFATKIITMMFILSLFSVMLFSEEEEYKLLSDTPMSEAAFGFGVDIDGDWSIVGAYGEDVAGDESKNGSVSIFKWNSMEWILFQKIDFPGELGWQVGFGYSVKIRDNVAVIGCPWDWTGFAGTGSIYVYEFNGTSWEFVQRLIPENAAGNDNFGITLDFDGQTIVAGASGTDLVAGTTVPNEMNYGAAYVYRKINGIWTEQNRLMASDGTSFDFFGRDVAVDGDNVVVGAYAGGLDDLHTNGPGKAYIFRLIDGEWTETQTLSDENGVNGDWFGRAIDIDDNTLIVGSMKKHTENGNNKGAVFIYTWNGTEWGFSQEIQAENPGEYNFFSSDVAIEGDEMIIGSAFWNDPSDGRVYKFIFNGSEWLQTETVQQSDPEYADDFGTSVALSGSRFIVGAPWKNYNNLQWAGAAYIYHNDNLPPVANAGSDIETFENDNVTLNGTDSYDPENENLTYVWTSPEGIILDDVNSVNPTFTAPDVNEETTFTFSLVVSDGEFDSQPDEVNVTVLPMLPVNNLTANSNGLVEWEPPSNAKDFTNHYNIYLDGELLQTNYEETFYQLTNLEDNIQYEVGLSAVYDEGESDIIIATFTFINTENENNALESNKLLGNYPNPFNPRTTIYFSITKNAKINLSIYNAKGQKVKSLITNEYKKGMHSIVWEGKNDFGKPVSSGIYFYVLNIDNESQIIKKCLLLK